MAQHIADAKSPATYWTYGYSVNDARKPILVGPPDEKASAAEYSSFDMSGQTCGADEWDGLPPAVEARREPLPCGVLWFTHISKTGGETVRHHLRNRVRKHGWHFLDLYAGSSPKSLRRAGRWEIERSVHLLARHLNATRPRLVVHSHDGVGGMGDYFLDRVLRPLSCRLAAEAAECKVVLATALRDPVARLVSQAVSDNLPPVQFGAYARAQANFQTKYLLFTTDWRVGSLFYGNASVERSLLEPARSVLAHYQLVGRTEELQRMLVATDALMGWTEPGFAESNRTLHNGHRAKWKWNMTAEQSVLARRFNAVDLLLYRSFCRAAGSRPRAVRPLCSADPEQAVRGLPHYYTASDVTSRDPAPSEWQMVFDGRGCHGFRLGDAYRMRCDEGMRPTLGGTLGIVSSYHREKNGKLTPCTAANLKAKACLSASG